MLHSAFRKEGTMFIFAILINTYVYEKVVSDLFGRSNGIVRVRI